MYSVWSCNSEQIISTIHKLLHTAEKPSRPKVTASGFKQSQCKVCENVSLIKLLKQLTSIYTVKRNLMTTMCAKGFERSSYLTHSQVIAHC